MVSKRRQGKGLRYRVLHEFDGKIFKKQALKLC